MNVVWYRLRVSESQRHTPIKIFPSTPPPRVTEELEQYLHLLRKKRMSSFGRIVCMASLKLSIGRVLGSRHTLLSSGIHKERENLIVKE